MKQAFKKKDAFGKLVILLMFTLVSVSITAQEKQNGYPAFEDSKMWVYEDGNANSMSVTVHAPKIQLSGSTLTATTGLSSPQAIPASA